ncbi:V-type proton ATPase subunit F-like [Musca domestica]|uniref:V-type proton ATPase subunit F-like n=1 Tax=Musca domestica TaxID=7370 RepID=A0A9J7DM31_MUSDO|nr:V-type proton ATPase subunit F-like [Musca domestica]
MDPTKVGHVRFPQYDGQRFLIAVIAKEEIVAGFALAGIGESLGMGSNQVNFMVVTKSTPLRAVENYLITVYYRSDIGVILIDSDIWFFLEPTFIKIKNKLLPIVLKIPTKQLPPMIETQIH